MDIPLATHQAEISVLIVDDEPHVRKFLRLSLQVEGFHVLEAATAEEAILLVHRDLPNIMILDLGLPDIDGRQVIRDVRLHSSLPILVLSGRTEDSEKIAALEQGADDYITKPFSVRDLVERVRSALEQKSIWQNRSDRARVMTGDLNIHLNNPEVRRGENLVDLDDEEYALIRLLAMHGGRVMTVGSIQRALWGHDGDPGHHHDLQKRIHALRRKLEIEPSFPRYIVTEPAVGYRLEMLPVVLNAA